MEFKELISAITETAGIDTVEPDSDGACHFMVDDIELSVIMLYEARKVVVTASVAPLADHTDAKLLRLMLFFNRLYIAGNGATMALDATENTVTMQRAESIEDLTEQTWLALLDNFLSQVHQWRDLITGYESNQDQAPQPQQVPKQQQAGEPQMPPSGWIAI